MTNPVISFFVPGLPRPGGSKRAFVPKGWTRAIVTDANPKAKDWKASVAHAAREAYKRPLLTTPLIVKVIFQMPRPKSHYGTGKNAGVLKDDAPYYHASKPDTLKLMRSTEDALTGILWRDDSANVVLHLSKVYNNQPGAAISVEEAI